MRGCGLVEFSRPYYVDGAAFLIKAGDPTGNTSDTEADSFRLSDLQQQTVALLNGSDTIPTVRSLLPAVRLRGLDSYAEAERLLASGEVAAFAADASVLTGLAQENPDYALIPTLISAEALGIATPKGLQQQQLRRQVNQAVERWQTNGWLQQQISRWGLPEEGMPSFIGAADQFGSSVRPSRRLKLGQGQDGSERYEAARVIPLP